MKPMDLLPPEAGLAVYRSRRDPHRPILDALTGRPASEPALLLSMDRHAQSLDLLFEGLRTHYIDAIASGRLDAWKTAAHAIVELCGTVDEARIVKRGTMQ